MTPNALRLFGFEGLGNAVPAEVLTGVTSDAEMSSVIESLRPQYERQLAYDQARYAARAEFDNKFAELQRRIALAGGNAGLKGAPYHVFVVQNYGKGYSKEFPLDTPIEVMVNDYTRETANLEPMKTGVPTWATPNPNWGSPASGTTVNQPTTTATTSQTGGQSNNTQTNTNNGLTTIVNPSSGVYSVANWNGSQNTVNNASRVSSNQPTSMNTYLMYGAFGLVAALVIMKGFKGTE